MLRLLCTMAFWWSDVKFAATDLMGFNMWLRLQVWLQT